MNCPICSKLMLDGVGGYKKCPSCNYMGSDFSAGAGADVQGISAVRTKNFEKILRILGNIEPLNGKTLLDVGSSSGSFLDAASAHGMNVFGIEPDSKKAMGARSKFTVWGGFFPEDLPSETIFDVIIFNDSIEHIPDLRQVVAGIERHLAPGGLVVVNLPTSDGLLFFIARILAKFGFTDSLDRLWQKNFTSPHIHYFNKKCLRKLFEDGGKFSAVESFSLATYTMKGLWRRVFDSDKKSKILSLFSCLFLIFLCPFSMMKSDILCEIFRRTDAQKNPHAE